MFARLLRRFASNSKTSRRQAVPRKPRRQRLDMENLETRLAPACTGVPSPPQLTFNCTAANDTIKVAMLSSTLLEMTVNSVITNWSLSGINAVTVNAGAGNDVIDVARTVAGKSLTVNAGDHNDTVHFGQTLQDMSFIQGPVTANAGPGSDAIHFRDNYNVTPTASYYLYATTFQRGGSAVVTHAGFNNGITVYGGHVNGTTYHVNGTPSYAVTLKPGIRQNTIYVRATSGPLNILGDNAAGPDDEVILGNAGLLQWIGGAVSVSSAYGMFELEIDGSNDPVARMVTLTATSLTGLTAMPITWVEADLKDLTIRGGTGGNTFTILDTPSDGTPYGIQMSISSGPGADIVNVRGTSPGGLWWGSDGLDTMNVGHNNSLQAIQGEVRIGNYTHATALNINASAATTAQTIGIYPGGIGVGPVLIDLVSLTTPLRALTINAGSGGNTFTVHGTPSQSPVTLNTGAGTDTVNVEAASSPMTINGQNGSDVVMLGSDGTVQGIGNLVHITNALSRTALIVDDTGNAAGRSLTLSAADIFGLATWVEADLSSLTLRGGSGIDTFTINDTPFFLAFQGVTLYAGGNGDTVRVRAAHRPVMAYGENGNDTFVIGTVANSLGGIGTLLTVNGGTGVNDSIILNDQGNATGQTYGLTAGSFTRQFTQLNHSNLETLTLNGTGFGDQINLGDMPGMTVTVNAGDGPEADTLAAPNAANLFVLNALGAGVLNATTTFSSVENLLGQDSADTFRFTTDLAGVAGWIIGGGGADTLDYSALAGVVVVNMPLYTATAVGGFIYQIENVTGGAGSDVLVGDHFSNVLDGGLGRDILIAGGIDWTTYEYTFAPDTLVGGGGEDVLIAGWTFYDWDAVTLWYFHEVWAGGGTYAQRVTELSVYLNPDTVYSNWAAGNHALDQGNRREGGGLVRLARAARA